MATHLPATHGHHLGITKLLALAHGCICKEEQVLRLHGRFIMEPHDTRSSC